MLMLNIHMYSVLSNLISLASVSNVIAHHQMGCNKSCDTIMEDHVETKWAFITQILPFFQIPHHAKNEWLSGKPDLQSRDLRDTSISSAHTHSSYNQRTADTLINIIK